MWSILNLCFVLPSNEFFMSPIERVSLRAQAFSTLGLPATATKTDIRKAYKKLALEKHPDQHPECANEFSRITQAYQTVCENADDLGIADGPKHQTKPSPQRRVSRPTVSATETSFDEATIAECKAALKSECDDGATHVATAVFRKGRYLTYFVPSPLAKGTNHVAVPTGMLHDTRHVMPKLLTFDHREAMGGYFEMPQNVCAEHFPGARQVQVRFAST